jgi:hypothetical protein
LRKPVTYSDFYATFRLLQLKLSETYPPLVPFFRESELRHGRTAMLAVVGYIVPDFFRIPGDAYSFDAVAKTVDAHDALLVGPMHQLLLWISLWDIVIAFPAIKAMNDGEREPGGKKLDAAASNKLWILFFCVTIFVNQFSSFYHVLSYRCPFNFTTLDYGFRWLAPKDDAGMKKMVDKELLNGRLAMVAIGGIATQTVLTGHGFPFL